MDDENDQLGFLVQFVQERILQTSTPIPVTVIEWLRLIRKPSIVRKCQCGRFILHPCLIIHEVPSCLTCTQEKLTHYHKYVQEHKLPFNYLTRSFGTDVWNERDEWDYGCMCNSDYCTGKESLTKILDEEGQEAYICDESMHNDSGYRFDACDICHFQVLKEEGSKRSKGSSKGIIQFEKGTSCATYCASCVTTATKEKEEKQLLVNILEEHFYPEIQAKLITKIQQDFNEMLPIWIKELKKQISKCNDIPKIYEWLNKEKANMFEKVNLMIPTGTQIQAQAQKSKLKRKRAKTKKLYRLVIV